MLSPHVPQQNNTGPRLVDPTVMFSRLRVEKKAQASMGREATVLAPPTPASISGVLGGTQKLGGY